MPAGRPPISESCGRKATKRDTTMLNKTKIALAAALVIGTASTALAAGFVEPGSLDGVNPAYHPRWFPITLVSTTPRRAIPMPSPRVSMLLADGIGPLTTATVMLISQLAATLMVSSRRRPTTSIILRAKRINLAQRDHETPLVSIDHSRGRKPDRCTDGGGRKDKGEPQHIASLSWRPLS